VIFPERLVCWSPKFNNIHYTRDISISKNVIREKNHLRVTKPTSVLTFATVSPMGHGRCGDRVANTPFLPPFNLGTLTYSSTDPYEKTSIKQKITWHSYDKVD